jgi:hypothetical protein|nr:MAG TPA: hypothetical protein [Caudoviricetes sp.]
MAQYKVKNTVEVEIRVGADSAESASHKAAMLIFNGFLNPNVIPTLEIRQSEVQLDDR